MNKTEDSELISAMADGGLRGEVLARGLQAVERDPQLQRTWDTYHLIGDVLRSPELAQGASSTEFLARLRPALARESAVSLATEAPPVSEAPRASAPNAAQRGYPQAANDGSFRWKLVAGLASVAAVAAVGWNLVGLGDPAQAQLAAAPGQPAAVATVGQGGLMLRDARLDELMAAHRQFGSATAIQMPSGALRNAAFETPTR